MYGVDKDIFMTFRNYDVDPGQLAAFRAAPDGVLVGETIAKRKKWEVGSQVDLREQFGLLMNIKGFFRTGSEEQDNLVLAGIDYVRNTRAASGAPDVLGAASVIYVKLREGADADKAGAAIDAMAAAKGMTTPTRTQPEKAFMSAMLDDLESMVSVSTVVILVTLLVVFLGVANTIAMTVRDRTQHIGVMRTLGFSRGRVLGLVLGESMAISLIGGLFGCAAAFVLFELNEVTVQARSYNFAIPLPWTVVAQGLGVAAAIGLLGGFVPAVRASRLSIVGSLRSVN